MNNKLTIGLLLLVVALAAVPGVSAYGTTGWLALHPTSNPTPEVCGGCHPSIAPACTTCHSNPFTLTVKANPTTVKVGTTAPVTFTVTRKASTQAVSAAVVDLSGVATGSGTTLTTGTAVINVNANSAGTITATASKTGYESGKTTLTANAPAPVLTTVTISPLNPTVAAGNTQQFSAKTLDQNSAPITATLTWASSNPTVGTINANGLFTAAVAGTTTITVTAVSGAVTKTASTTVTVTATPKVLTTVTISPLSPTVAAGNTQQFSAKTLDQNSAPITATLTWASSNTTAGTINANGLFTAAVAGTTTITVTAVSGAVTKTATTTVTVTATPKVLTTVTISPLNPTVAAGNTQQFSAKTLDQNSAPITATLTWASSNPTVGTINANGLFTAAVAGTTTITVTAVSGAVTKTASTTVTVTATPKVLTTVTISPLSPTVAAGNTQQFSAKTLDQNSAPITATLTWASSNTAVGTINANGLFTAAGAGTTTITVTAVSGAVTVTNETVVTVTSQQFDKDEIEEDEDEHDDEDDMEEEELEEA